MSVFSRFFLSRPVIIAVSICLLGVPSMVWGQEASQEAPAKNAPAAAKEKEDGLIPIPKPPLDHLEEAVSQQLRKGRRMVDAVAKNEKVSREKRARAYGELGQLYHAYTLTDAAKACYHNALVFDPTHFEWNYSLGYLLQTTGKFSEALQRYRHAKDTGKDSLDLYLVHIRMGECYRDLNQSHQAKLAFEAAYQINPEGAAVLARLGDLALKEKRYDDAIKYFLSALEKQPAANKLHYSLAMAYRGSGKMEEARLHLAKRGMVGVQPPDPLKTRLAKLVTGYWVHVLAGKLAFSAGHYNEAAEAFEKAVKAEPKKAGARINLGATLAQMKKYREAIAQFQAALQLRPNSMTAHFNLGTLYGYLGNHEKAVEHLQIVVGKSPKDSKAHLELANALHKNKQFNKAFEHYQTALKLEPTLTLAWLNLSSLLSSANQHGEALKVLEEAHSRMPYDGPIAHALARQLAASPLLEKREGKRALELALRVFSAFKDFEHARTVAMAYAQLNQCDKAVEWMQLAIDMASKSPEANQVLSRFFRNLEHFKTQRPCRVPPEQ